MSCGRSSPLEGAKGSVAMLSQDDTNEDAICALADIISYIELTLFYLNLLLAYNVHTSLQSFQGLIRFYL